MGKLFDILSKRSNEPDIGASRSSVKVTDEACSAARRPTSARVVHEQDLSDVEDSLSVHVSDMEKENSGFLFSTQGSERSGSEEIISCNRSVVDVEVHKSDYQERFQRYCANTIGKDKPCTEGEEKSLCNALSDKFGEDACAYRVRDRTGLKLEKNQIDVLQGSWRSETPQRITCFRDNYRQFPN